MTKPTQTPTWSGQEIAFGPFRLYPDARMLLRSDKPVQLGSRARACQKPQSELPMWPRLEA